VSANAARPGVSAIKQGRIMMSSAPQRGGRRFLADAPTQRSALPRLSVVTVVRNGQATLEACIRSVAEQTYPHVEHIVVDGASTDGTLDILRRHERTLEAWISEPDTGIYNALNKAVRLCSGDHYVVLGCDDLLLPTAAESFMRHADKGLVVFGWVRFQSPRKGAMLIRNHSAGALIHMEAHRRLGLYDESYRIAADTKFLSAARRAGIMAEFDEEVGVFVAGGASGNYARNVSEHARAMRESGAWGALRCMAWKTPRLALAALRR
jgi:glycosyltransferase involved in cell wall biosynthesis